MKMLNSSLIAMAVAATLASAHLQVGSLSVKGGETFTVGQKFLVTFVANTAHDGKYDFYFSKDAGATFTEFVSKFQGPTKDGDTVKYNWTIPNSATTKGQFRVCQVAGGECTDPIYILKSGNFTISTASGIAEGRAAMAAPSLRFDEAGGLEAGFTLGSAETVTLQAFDSRGHVVANLLDGRQEAGEHHFSLFSNALQSASGHLMFKLTLGGETYTRVLNTLR